jgi:predicted Zn-dependent peptidase
MTTALAQRGRRTPVRLAATDFHPPREAPYRVARTRLDNGLRVVTVHTPHLHTATVALYVGAGSRYETPTTNGLSHFVEHMLFRGSAKHPSSFALNLAIEELGGTLYAETGRDYSLYQVSLSPRGVPDAMAILAELFREPLFSDIELERQIILEEQLEDLDDRGRNVNIDDLSRATAFPGHPLGMSIIGPARNVRRFDVRDVRTHFRRLYVARNMVLCVGGCIDAAHASELARTRFGALPAGARAVPRPAHARAVGPQLRSIDTDSAQAQLQLVFRGLADSDRDYPAMIALVRLLDDGMATPLHYRICDQKGLAYSVAAEVEPLHDTSLLEIDAACAPGKLTELVDELFGLLRELRDRPPTAEALDRTKRRYRDQLEASYDDVESLCGWFGGTELFFRPKTHAERVRMMERVTAEQVVRVARRVLAPERLVAVVSGALGSSLVAQVRRRVAGFPG